MNEHFTAKYLADMKLDGYPKTKAGILKLSEKEGWLFEWKMDRGGQIKVFPYKTLPVPFQGEISLRTGTPPNIKETGEHPTELALKMEKPLTKNEQKRKEELEGVIVKNLRAFVEVGLALREIRDNRLYRKSHTNFEDYCQEMYEIVRRSADRYIAAAEVVEDLQNQTNWSQSVNSEIPLPLNESQVRPLVSLPPLVRGDVWLEAVKATPNGKPTGRIVKKAVEEFTGKQLEKNYRKPTGNGVDHDKESLEYAAALDTFFEAVKKEKKGRWKKTSRSLVLKDLKKIEDYIGI
ncbi:MAG: hypothetical protein OEV42_19455 [Deltaproteobacteria bacterium]|nr:hypothetical protein [Deltaproteobacteria bacterium]